MKLRMPETISVYGENYTRLDTKNEHSDVSLNAFFDKDSLAINVSATATPLTKIVLKWALAYNEKRNESVKVLSDAWERAYGELEWLPINENRALPWYFLVSNGTDKNRCYEGRFTEAFGVLVRPSAFCHWNYSADYITLTLDIRNGGKGVLLGGRVLTVANIVFAEYRDCSAFSAACEFCKVMSSSPILPREKVFGFNDWYCSYGSSDEKMILDSTKRLNATELNYACPPYSVIDDGWQPNGQDGPWIARTDRFSDMKLTAKRTLDLGAKPGLWFRPLIQIKENPEIPDSWRLSRCKSSLDPSNSEVLKYVSDTVKKIVGWGYKLIKHDFSTFDIFGKWGFEYTDCIGDDGWSFQDRSLTTAEIILKLYKTIRDAAGYDTVIIGCNTVSHLCAGLVELNRTGDDTSGKEWERTLKMGVNTLVFRLPQNNAFYMADADCVGITNDVPWELNSKWLYLLAVSGSPTFVSWSLDVKDKSVSDAVCAALKRNSIQNDVLIPLDWMETKTPSHFLINGEEIEIDWSDDKTVISL